MIGELIAMFENSEGTVKDFNNIFRHSPIIEYMYDAEVEIGPLFGGVRELTITPVGAEPRIVYHEIKSFGNEALKAEKKCNAKPVTLYYADGSTIGTFNDTNSARAFLNVSMHTYYKWLKEKRIKKDAA